MADEPRTPRPPRHRPEGGEGRPQRKRPEGGFKLKKFPKEFERDVMGSFDRTYYSILILSFIVVLPLVFTLSQNASSIWALSVQELADAKEKLIRKIYVQLAEEEEPKDTKPEEEEKPEEVQEEEAQEERKKELEERKSEPTKKPSLADLRKARLNARNKIAAQKASDQAAVASSGAIALLTGGEGATGQAAADLLGDASSSDINLDKALSKVDGLALGANGKGKPGSGLRGRGTKGGLVDGGGNVDGLVGGIGGAGSKSLGTRKGGIKFGAVAVRGGKGEKSRSSGEITKVIRKTTPAIEQCFKREQRLNPSLRGVITVTFKITKRGTIRDVKISGDTVGSSRVASCVKRVISRMRGFGRAKSDVIVPDVKFTFN
jgi:outer membrane biosynthesis protein TonB